MSGVKEVNVRLLSRTGMWILPTGAGPGVLDYFHGRVRKLVSHILNF